MGRFTQIAAVAASVATVSVQADSSLASTGFASAEEYVLPSVSYSELHDSQEGLIQSLGIFAVTNVPGLAEARQWAMNANARCVADASVSELGETYLNKFAMQDGTARYTFAAKDDLEMVIPDELVNAFSSCAELKLASKAIRGAFDEVTSMFIQGTLSPHSTGVHDTSPNRVHLHAEALHGSTLDHLHAYQSDDSHGSSDDATLQMHTDQGLFVVFSPAMMLNGAGQVLDSSSGAGFFIEMPKEDSVTTEMYRAVFPATDCLVVMFGNGANKIDPRVRAVPHAIHMPSVHHSSASPVFRMWMGRMFLATTMDLEGIADDVAHSDHLDVGCGPGKVLKSVSKQTPLLRSAEYRVLADVASSCSRAGTELCWLMCLPVPDCSSDETAMCLSSSGALWVDGDTHCTDCAMRCTKKPPVGPNGFCSGLVTNMYMDGFKGVGNEVDPCILFLFRQFNLNSWGAYVGGMIASFVLGLITEYLVKYRRHMHKRMSGKGMTLKQKLLRAMFYTLAVTIGYIDMLIAMTYSGPLFAAVVLGLGAGHFAFNIEAPVSESADPCCIGEVEEVTVDATNSPEKPQRRVSNTAESDTSENIEDSNNQTRVTEAACCHQNADDEMASL